jgi:beta-lactamase class A
LGGTIVVDRNISCPKDMALYMKRVYEFSKSNKVLGGQLINYLENTVFNDRIPKLLPKSVKVAHKIGNYWDEEWGMAFHDVGIIYTKKPYILAVMSRNVNDSEAFNVIAAISKKVYDFQVKQK